ncbi:MAG TPA: hypothetical protein VK970_15170 [Candidatus Methylacidiphilales bacterium]|nr:hypothetical protein [Candidatus Methylacidiphilales bacterium]
MSAAVGLIFSVESNGYSHTPGLYPAPTSPSAPSQRLQASPDNDGGKPIPPSTRPSSKSKPGDIELAPEEPPPPAPAPAAPVRRPSAPIAPAPPPTTPPDSVDIPSEVPASPHAPTTPSPSPGPAPQPVRPSWVQIKDQIIRGITSVALNEAGRVKIIHSEGGGSFDRALVPEDFLAAWGIASNRPATPPKSSASSLPYPTVTPEDANPPPPDTTAQANAAPTPITQQIPARPAPRLPTLEAPMGLRWGMPGPEASSIMTKRSDTLAVNLGPSENKLFFKGGRFADFRVERYELLLSAIGLYHVTVVMDGTRDPITKFEEVRNLLTEKFGKPSYDNLAFGDPYTREDSPDTIIQGMKEGRISVYAVWTWQAPNTRVPSFSLRCAYTTSGTITIEYSSFAYSISNETKRNTKDL